MSNFQTKSFMVKRDEVVQVLRQHQHRFEQQFSVKTLSFFGSTARDEGTAKSDVDLLVEFSRPVGLFGLFALQNRLEKLLDCPVDLGTPNSLKPRIRERVLKELAHVAGETVDRPHSRSP